MNARGVWNQPNYRITNVEDDLTIPPLEPPSWLEHNSFRGQELRTGCRFALPDLTASFLRVTESGTERVLTVRIGNAGAAAAAETPVMFYDGDPDLGGTPLAAARRTTSLLLPGQFEDVSLTLAADVTTRHGVFVAADDRGNRKGRIAEIFEDNNLYDTGVPWLPRRLCRIWP